MKEGKEGRHAHVQSVGIRRLGCGPLIRTFSATEEVAALLKLRR
jgi:hypothetical protein